MSFGIGTLGSGDHDEDHHLGSPGSPIVVRPIQVVAQVAVPRELKGRVRELEVVEAGIRGALGSLGPALVLVAPQQGLQVRILLRTYGFRGQVLFGV